MTNDNAIPQKTIDVRHLPSTDFDYKAPLWWGNLWGLVIETVAFGVLIAVYFTVWMALSPFPPPQVDRFPINYNTEPDLTIPTINLIVLLVSLVPGVWLDLAARRMDQRAVRIALVVTLAFTIVSIVLRFYEFDSLYFKWNDNAYGSITWTLLGMHLIHLFVMAVEDIFEIVWAYGKGLNEKQALDITVMAVYWYWVVATGIVVYLVVFWAPRFL